MERLERLLEMSAKYPESFSLSYNKQNNIIITENIREDEVKKFVFDKDVLVEEQWLSESVLTYTKKYCYHENGKMSYIEHTSQYDEYPGEGYSYFEYFYYDDNWNLVVFDDEIRGVVKRYTYDSDGRMVTERHSDGFRRNYVYHSDGTEEVKTRYQGGGETLSKYKGGRIIYARNNEREAFFEYNNGKRTVVEKYFDGRVETSSVEYIEE